MGLRSGTRISFLMKFFFPRDQLNYYAALGKHAGLFEYFFSILYLICFWCYRAIKKQKITFCYYIRYIKKE